MTVALLCCLIATAVVAASASTSDLAAFLERAEKMAVHNRAVRADIKISREGVAPESAVLIIDPASKRQLFAVKSSGWRSLLPLAWADGKAVENRGGKTVRYGVDQPLAGTDFRAMEFFPFWTTDYSTAFISDDSRLEKTVTLYARESTPYKLFVLTFDKTKLVPNLIKYYRDSFNNLVRLRSDSDYVMVGSRPRPQKIVVQDFTENSRTTFELAWRLLDRVPAGLMDEGSFATADIDWGSDSFAER